MQIYYTYDDELKGLKSYSGLFHTAEGKNFTKYNNWNFTSAGDWDGNKDKNFWYSPETTLLYFTSPTVLGKESVSKVDIPL